MIDRGEMTPQKQLEQTFDRMWDDIRGAKLYAGQPRSEASAQSVSLARRALHLATESQSDRLLLQAWGMLAYSLTANEQYGEAIPYYKNAIEKLESMGEQEQAARQRIGYVAALTHAGRHLDALDVAEVADKWFTKTGNEHARARLFTNLGILYRRLDDYTNAAKYYRKAANIFEAMNDRQALAQTCLNLANCFSNIDRFEESNKLYERSEKLSDELGLADLSAQASYNRAYLSFLRGRYSEALQAFSRLRDRFEISGSQRHGALCDLDQAEIYLQLNLAEDASILARRASAYFRDLNLPYERAKATTFYGVALMQLRRFSEALDAFSSALKLFEKEGNLYWVGLLDLYRAELYFSLGRHLDARTLARQAKQTFEQLAIPSKRIASLVLSGRIAYVLNDLVGAEVTTAEIHELIRKTTLPLVLFPYYLLRAEIAERMGKWDEAQLHYEIAAQELERHQTHLHHDDLRVTFLEGRQHAHEALVRLSLDRRGPEEGLSAAYEWCERARSRGLVELLAHHAPSALRQPEHVLLAKVRKLREELNVEYARSKPEARQISLLPSYHGIALKERELARTLREVSRVNPECGSLQQVSTVTINSVREVLPARTTVVEYFTSGDEVLAFVVSRDNAKVFRRLCQASCVSNLQDHLRFQFEQVMLDRDCLAVHSRQFLESTRDRLTELYRSLVAPLIGEIRTPHIAIVPHSNLHFLPFHAFHDGERYLIDNYEISYAPSASVLKYCLEKPGVQGKSPLLVGIADENAPLIREEISRLSRLFPDARILRDATATRAAFAENSTACSFIHIGTHTIFRQDNPMFSSFKLADGWCTALDLFSMTCQTNLVTLSGCQSGMGAVTRSDDLMGLMRGFLYAGARSLLLSLWNVHDEATAALMLHFYQEWQKGATRSAAFRSALLATRQEHPNPFYWAPFFLVGNP